MTNLVLPAAQTLALRPNAPDMGGPGTMTLAGLCLAVVGASLDAGRLPDIPDVPIYVRLRKELMRSGAISSSTVPHWPASDW